MAISHPIKVAGSRRPGFLADTFHMPEPALPFDASRLVAPEADRSLLDAVRDHAATEAATFEAAKAAGEDPAWEVQEALMAQQEAYLRMPANTLHGVLIKLRYAATEVEPTSKFFDDIALLSAVADLDRMLAAVSETSCQAPQTKEAF